MSQELLIVETVKNTAELEMNTKQMETGHRAVMRIADAMETLVKITPTYHQLFSLNVGIWAAVGSFIWVFRDKI